MRAKFALVCLGLAAAGCADRGPSYRALHVVDGQDVYSRPVAGYAYEAYLRARLALEHEPPALQEAQTYIESALQYDPRDPHLWTTRAEIAAELGDPGAAMWAADRALQLSPGYPPAEELVAHLQADDRYSNVAR